MAKPEVIVHNIASVDGRLTIAPDVLLLFGDERWTAAAGPMDDPYEYLIKTYHPQAILEGSGSLALPGDPGSELPLPEASAQVLLQDYLPSEITSSPGRKWMVVVDGQGRIRWMYKEFPGETWAGFYLLVLVSPVTPLAYLEYLRREKIPYLLSGETRVDLTAALEKLASTLHVQRVVAAGGGKLNGALLRQGLVDEIDLELFPAVIGGPDTPSLFDAPALLPTEMPALLTFISSQVMENGHIRLRYRVGRAEKST